MPVIDATLTTTGSRPAEVSVTVCVAGVFRFTSPKVRVVALMFSNATAAPSCNENVLVTVPAVAESVTVAPVLTEETVAVKLALVDPAATVTVAGTDTSALLLLPRFTAKPPVAAAAFSVTVQLSVPGPVKDPFAQLNPVSTGTPVPLRFTTVDVPVDELLVRVTEPEAAPAATGLNCTVRFAVRPPFRVSGKVTPEMLNPDPATTPALSVTGAVPVEDKVMVCLGAALTAMLPKFTLAGLTLSVEIHASNSSVKVCATVPALADNVIGVDVVTEETVAVKLALAAPATTVTVRGTDTSVLLLLPRLTTRPPVAAAAFSVTVQLSVPAPVIVPFAQFNPVSTGTPVPLKPTTVEVPVDELLVKVSDPEISPDVPGSNLTVSVAVWLGFSVSGKLAPEIVKPDPATVAALTVTGPVPVEDKVMVCVVEVLTEMLPKFTLDGLTLSVAVPAPSCKAKVLVTEPAVAVSVTVVAVVTVEIVAAKVALEDPAATFTEVGTDTSVLLLLERLTAKPPVNAAAFSVTVQLSVPAPLIVPFAQVNPLSTGTPLPLRLTTVDAPVEELLVKVSVPVAAPEVAGSNTTVRVAV